MTLTVSPDTGADLTSPLAPHVQPAYYGALIVNEVIGTTGSATLSELSINDDTLAGYAAYEDGLLARVALLDSQAFLSDDAGERAMKSVQLEVGDSVSSVEVKRLFMA